MNSWTLSFGACVRFTAETVLLSPCNLIHMTGAISLRKLPVQGLSIFDRLTLLLKWSRILHISIIALQSQARFKCRQLIEIICIMNHCLLRSFPAKQRPCCSGVLCRGAFFVWLNAIILRLYSEKSERHLSTQKEACVSGFIGSFASLMSLWQPPKFGPASASKYLPYPVSLMEIHSRKGTPAGLTSFHLGFRSFEWLVLTLALGNKRDAASPHLHVDPQTCVILCSFT